MDKSRKSILIIAFKFPPLGGMRVKRMTMFAKYLARRGYTVHVLTVNWKTNAPNTWLEETRHPNIIIHRIPSCAPQNLLESRPKTVLKKLLRKIARLLKRLVYFVDEAQYWGFTMLPYASKLIRKEGITNVICTGAPFMANYWAARLKAKLPHIHLLQDFRDPWNDHLCAPDNPYFWFTWQKKISQACERYALNYADVVITVTDALGERFKQRTGCKAHFVTISNGFDPDRYCHQHFTSDTKKMRLVYIGNLFVGRDKLLQMLLQSIVELADQNPEFGRTFELVTYGGFPPELRWEARHLENRGLLHIHGYVSPDEAIEAAGNAFALLLVNAARFSYLVSGKVYEYMALNRPIYAITPEGELTKLVRQGDLGVIASPSSSVDQQKELLKLFELWQNNPGYVPPSNEQFREQFQYPNLISRLVTYLT